MPRNCSTAATFEGRPVTILGCASSPPLVLSGLVYMCTSDGDFFTCGQSHSAEADCRVNEDCTVEMSREFASGVVNCESEAVKFHGICPNICTSANLTQTSLRHSYSPGSSLPWACGQGDFGADKLCVADIGTTPAGLCAVTGIRQQQNAPSDCPCCSTSPCEVESPTLATDEPARE